MTEAFGQVAGANAEAAPVDVFDIAAYFARQDGLQGEPDVTPMKLQKLLYLAQAHYLAATMRRLFDERIEAYEHGPVITKVWSRTAGQRTPIVAEGKLDIVEHTPLPPTIEEFLDRVWSRYKDLSASALRRLTHEQDPWRNNYVEGRLHSVIPDPDIIRYFGTKLPLNKRIFPLLPDPETGQVENRPAQFGRDRREAVTVADRDEPRCYKVLAPTVVE